MNQSDLETNGNKWQETVEKMMLQTNIKDYSEFVRALNDNEIVVFQRKWFRHDNIISFFVKSDGTTGQEWIRKLEDKGYPLTDNCKEFLLSEKFKPTNDFVYQIAVLSGGPKNFDDLYYGNFSSQATFKGLDIPSLEVSCLIRDKFSHAEMREMGLVFMCGAFEQDPESLQARFAVMGKREFSIIDHNGKDDWSPRCGFIFVASQSKI